MGSAGWKWVRRIRNSECGIVRVETARGRIVVFQYKKRLWWALFIDAIFCIEMCGYAENLSLWRRNSCINTRALYAVVTNPIARKGVQRGEDPLGSPINTRKLYANVPNSIARKGQGSNSLAGSRGSALGSLLPHIPQRPQPADNIHLPRGFQRGGGQDGGNFAVSAPPGRK